MAVSVDQFGKALVASGLMPADEVKAQWAALPAESRPKTGDAFAQALVDRGKLTAFQAKETLEGRGSRLVMGDYVILQEIGAGGMGQVYKARHRRMERIVALKVMSAAAMKDEAAVKRFQREVKAAARLEHPNIVTAYDSGEAGNVKYLVMQFVDGGDLSSLVKKNGPQPIERALDFVVQAARGLAFAHGEGVIHRDIKPANLLLDQKGVIKILDMGLARIESGDDGLTATEQVMGTVDYMSPEQAANTKGVDARADIYSLGCTLWFLLTGKKAYEADTMIARLMAHRDAPLPSLVKTRDDAPWPLEQAFHRMIAKAPQDRFQSMDEVVAALEPFGPLGGGARVGMGSSIGMGPGPQDAELASFLKNVGPPSKSQVKPAPGGTKVDVEATAQFISSEAATDPKSEIITPAKPTVAKPKPKAAANKNKASSNKTMLFAGAGGAVLLAAVVGAWFGFGGKRDVGVAAAPGQVAAVANEPRPYGSGAVSGSQPPLPDGRGFPQVSFATKTPDESGVTPTTSIAMPPNSPPPGDYVLQFTGFDKNGINDSAWADVPSLLVGETGPLTLEARVLALRHNEGFVVGTDDFRLRLKSGNWTTDVDRLRLKEFPIEYQRWYHLAAVRTDGEVRMYVDGKRFDVAPLPSRTGPQPPPRALPLQIGGKSAQTRIDEIRISKTVRYDADFTPPTRHEPDADTLALYHCDDGAGDVLKDASGNGHDGKIVKPTWLLLDGSPLTTTPSIAELLTSPDYEWTEPEHLGRPLNFGQFNSSPWVSADGLEMWFSAAGLAATKDPYKHDLFVARRPSTAALWDAPQNVGPPLNGPAADGDASLTADRLSVFFTSDERAGISFATRTALDQPWSTPVVPAGLEGELIAPVVSADGLTLLCAQVTADKKHDIVVLTRKTKLDPWSPLTILPAPINTPATEAPLWLSADGTALLFKSDRQTGSQGRSDLWLATRTTAADAWQAPLNLGPTINSADDEKRACLSADGQTMWLAREKANGAHVGIYESRRVKRAAAEPAPAGAATTVDLLPLVDLSQDALGGRWTKQGTEFHSAAVKDEHHRLRLPVAPGDEYSLRLAFTANRGYPTIVLPLDGAGVPIAFDGASVELRLAGPNARREVADRTNVSVPVAPAFTNGKRHDVTVELTRPAADQVRIAVTADGKPTLDWTGTRDQLRAVPNPSADAALVFIAYQVIDAPTMLHEARLTTTAGTMRPIRAAEGASPGNAN